MQESKLNKINGRLFYRVKELHDIKISIKNKSENIRYFLFMR